MSEYTLRAAESGDASAVLAVHQAAFKSGAESGLVRSLLENGDVVLSLVAEHKGKIIGSAVYSRLLIDGNNRGATALAPLGILPDWQVKGIGSALIGDSHARLAGLGESLVFVLGDPDYYRRFGFSAEGARSFRTPYDGPYLMTLELGKDAPKNGVVTYAKAFSDLV